MLTLCLSCKWEFIHVKTLQGLEPNRPVPNAWTPIFTKYRNFAAITQHVWVSNEMMSINLLACPSRFPTVSHWSFALFFLSFSFPFFLQMIIINLYIEWEPHIVIFHFFCKTINSTCLFSLVLLLCCLDYLSLFF